MFLKLANKLVFVLAICLNWIFVVNVFVITSGVTLTSALETGLEIEKLKSEQSLMPQWNEENKFRRNIEVATSTWFATKEGDGLDKANHEDELKAEKQVTFVDDSKKTAKSENEHELSNSEDDSNFQDPQKFTNTDVPDLLAEESISSPIKSAENTSPRANIYANEEPNIISSSLNFKAFDIKSYHNFREHQRRVEDFLVLNSIEEDPNFDWGDENVLEWLHVEHNLQNVYIGRRLTDLLLVLKNNEQPETAMVINIGDPIMALATYSYWNFNQHQQEPVILAACDKQILFYLKNVENEQFELYGNRTFKSSIKVLKYFSSDFKNYLVVCSERPSLDIYNFDLKSLAFKRLQRLELEMPCLDINLLATDQEIILVVAQLDEIFIYISDQLESQSPNFLQQDSIKSQDLHSIQTFQIGGQSYLALAAASSQIMLYHRGQFKTKTHLDHSFGLVESFLPIPIKNYRDDLILLVQYKIENITSLEVLIWNGDSFEVAILPPCQETTKCLEASETLKGSVLLNQREGISLLIPGLKTKSKLFHFHTEMLPKNSEYLDLLETFEYLKNLVQERYDIINQIQQFLETPEADFSQMLDKVSSLEQLETPELDFDGEVQDIYLNDHKWSQDDSDIDLNFLINSIEDLEKSLSAGRQRRELDLTETAYTNLNLDVVVAEELEIENLNGLPFYIQEGFLNFPGEIHFKELEVLDKVVEPQKRQIEPDDLVFDGDLEFEYINDIKWEDFKENIILRNRPQKLKSLKVEGEVIAEDTLTIKTLNSLSFPDDYLVSNGPRSSIVRAEKYFNKTLSANSVDTDGVINGQNPVEAITLMDGQEWQGSAIFNQLEVSEKLELHGNAHGRNVDSFPTNPTLLESNLIEADCVFNELQVNGPIVIKGDLDDKPLGDLLKNILQKPEDPTQEIEIAAAKSFNLAIFPTDFELLNNTINEIHSEKFVTLHTAQTLQLNAFDGYVYFYNLTLHGLYDDIRIEELQQELIQLDKPLDLSSVQLVFQKELEAKNLIVLNRLNDMPLKNNLQTLDEDLVLETAEFERVETKQADFAQDIMGPGKLNNIELHEFIAERTWHEPPIKGNLFVKELIAAQGLKADELHGIKAQYLLDFLQNVDALPEMVLNGQIQVEHITVLGDVQVQQLNGQMFDEDLQMSVIWLNRPNYLTNNLTFKNPLEIYGNIYVEGSYQGQSMPELLADMVLREDDTLVNITAPKSFLKPVYVLQNTELQAINGMPFKNIALKSKENIFQGSVKIKGKLTVDQLQVEGDLPNAHLNEIADLLYYDPQVQNFVLKQTINFENKLALHDLTVLGDYDDLTNLTDFFENLIYKNQPCQLSGNNTFTGRVSIEQDAFVHQLNGHDLETLFKNLIFIHETEPLIIKSPIQFDAPIMSDKIFIRNLLKTETLSGCSIAEWLNNTLRVDQDQYIPHFLHFAPGSLDGNSLNVHFINDLDLSRILTLHTPQQFNESVKFSEVYLQGVIETMGNVNGMDLEEEYNNTLMIYGGQHITTPLTIQSIAVLQDLQILGPVNTDKNLSDVATLNENLEFKSPIYFQSLYSPRIIAKDLITGIDMEKWFENALRKVKPTQYITGNWSARQLTVKSGPYDFQYTINGFEPAEYNAFIRSIRSYDGREQHEICELLKQIWQQIERKSILIKYIEEDLGMSMDDIKRFKKSEGLQTKKSKLFHLNTSTDHYLLLNEYCKSHLFKWHLEQNKFIYFDSYESGPIAQVMVLQKQNSSSLDFITNFETTETINCTMKGLNLWSTKDNKTLHERFLNHSAMDIQRSANSDNVMLLLTKDKVKELDLLTLDTKRKWKIPFVDGKSSKINRFVAKPDTEEIFITNGFEMVSLNEQNNRKIKKQINTFNLFTYIPLPSWLGFPQFETVSYLKPNTTMARKFAFNDFKPLLQRLLLDLSEKLNQQINITQLSIPESDLFDEHLIPDFIAIMDELQHQQIYPKEQMNLKFDHMALPETPAQVLAAKVVQLVWPVAEELQEMHDHLKDNKTHNHPLCLNITQSLMLLIEDVLHEAYANEPSKQLHKVIERIRLFDQHLHKIVQILNMKSKRNDAEDHELVMSASSMNERTLDNSTTFDSNSQEILALTIGSISNPRILLAVTKVYTTMTPGQDSAIYLHPENLNTNPYQIIYAHNPRSLTEVRLKQETLLIFIENCCHIQIWRFQGSRGFIQFAEFKSETEIQQILTVKLPQNEAKFKHYLAVLLDDKVKFYEIVVNGISQEPPNLPCS